jgi:hypothetical protein
LVSLGKICINQASKKKKKSRVEGVAQVTECLSSKSEALTSNPSIIENEKEGQRREDKKYKH